MTTRSISDNYSEYTALRTEITTRLEMVSQMISSTTTTMLTIMLISITLFVGTFNMSCCSNILFWAYFAFDLLSSIIFLVISYSLSYKFGENLRQIAMISAYLIEFYENDNTEFFWEKAQRHPVIDLKNLPRSKRTINYFYLELSCLPMLTFIGYAINWLNIIRINAYTDVICLCLLIVIGVLIFITSCVFLVVSMIQISIKKNMGKFGKSCSVKFKFHHDSQKEENKPQVGNEIPKKIHLFWFSETDLTEKEIIDSKIKYYESWKKAGYEYKEDADISDIKVWKNSDLKPGGELDIRQAPQYVQDAYADKHYAFVSDYFRLKVLYKHGGIYLDTDIELKESLEEFRKNYKGFIGFDFDDKRVSTACFGVVRENKTIKAIMDLYEKLCYKDNEANPFLLANTFIYTAEFLKRGLIADNTFQFVDGIAVFPKEYFCANKFPYEASMDLKRKEKREKRRADKRARGEIKPFAVHHYDLSWAKSKSMSWKDYSTKEWKWVEKLNEKAELNKEIEMKSNF